MTTPPKLYAAFNVTAGCLVTNDWRKDYHAAESDARAYADHWPGIVFAVVTLTLGETGFRSVNHIEEVPLTCP